MNPEAGNETERLRSKGSCEEHGPFIMQFSRAHDVRSDIGFSPTAAEKGVILMAGRKPKPTALKKLEGNPGKRHSLGRPYRTSFPQKLSHRTSCLYRPDPAGFFSWLSLELQISEAGQA